MVKFLLTVLTSAAVTAGALAVAALVLPGFSMTWQWWLVATVLFTVISVVLRVVTARVNTRWIRAYTITGGLAITLLALWLTDLVVPGSGFELDGPVAWIGVTALLWAAGIAFGEVDSHAPAATPGVSPEVRSSFRDGERRAS